MVAYTHFAASSSHVSAHRSAGIAKLRPLTSAEKVKKYTEDLVLHNHPTHALHRLWQLGCPVKVFEDCQTERVIERYQWMEQHKDAVEELKKKFATLRRREARDRTVSKFDNTAMENRKIKESQMESAETNFLFANAICGKKIVEPRKTARPDYSKFKIVKRSKPATPIAPSMDTPKRKIDCQSRNSVSSGSSRSSSRSPLFEF